ncbi:MAG: hypothetical protein DME08_05045 [Candidatus Rokuibacteriota bacterium]|nr:MAG: hypothetical protein DME08_05045 [Candidatus Rokubacteria bacterium]
MKFRYVDRCIALAVVAFLPVVALASSFEVTPTVLAELEKQSKVLAAWAADPVVVAAVKEQNAKGPIAGMDNAKWKAVRRSDPTVQALVGSAAGQLLRGQEKFDVPMRTGKAWQMTRPWFDESLQGYALQVAVPVMDGGKAIGVLVASVPVTYLERVAKK